MEIRVAAARRALQVGARYERPVRARGPGLDRRRGQRRPLLRQATRSNPYSEDYAEEAWHCWHGWQEADWYLGIRGQEEARRWLEEAA